MATLLARPVCCRTSDWPSARCRTTRCSASALSPRWRSGLASTARFSHWRTRRSSRRCPAWHRHPDLVWVSGAFRERPRAGGMSYPEYLDYRDGSRGIFSSLIAFAPTSFSLGSGGEPERIRGHLVTGSYFAHARRAPRGGTSVTAWRRSSGRRARRGSRVSTLAAALWRHDGCNSASPFSSTVSSSPSSASPLTVSRGRSSVRELISGSRLRRFRASTRRRPDGSTSEARCGSASSAASKRERRRSRPARSWRAWPPRSNARTRTPTRAEQ